MYQGHLQRNLKTVRDRRLRCHNAKILAISHHPLVSHWSLEEPELSESVPTPHIRLQPERSECAQSVTTAQPQSQNVRMNSAQIRPFSGLTWDLCGSEMMQQNGCVQQKNEAKQHSCLSSRAEVANSCVSSDLVLEMNPEPKASANRRAEIPKKKLVIPCYTYIVPLMSIERKEYLHTLLLHKGN